MILYFLTIQFPTPPLLATQFFFFLHLLKGIPLRHSSLYLPSKTLYFSSLWASTKSLSSSLSQEVRSHYLSLQYHHQFLSFLSFSLKICRYQYHSKKLISTPSMNIQSFSLSQAQPILRKKTLLQQSILTINRSEKKEDFYCKKSFIADLFQQFYKTGSTFGFSGSQVEPADFYCLSVFKVFLVFYHNRTGLEADSRLNWSVRFDF